MKGKIHMVKHPFQNNDSGKLLAGWALCTVYVVGENITTYPKEVTCKTCLKMMEKNS